jgi:histidinol-phosphate aminotransferase
MSLICDQIGSNIRELAAYVPGKPTSTLARELGIEESSIVKLASNENPLGPSPKAVSAMQAALKESHLYPDGSGFELKRVIGDRFNVKAEELVLGNGSNDVLELVARTVLKPGDSAVYSKHAFAVYPLAVKAVGAKGIEVPTGANFATGLQAMHAAITSMTKVVFLANPNNPTGTFIEPATVESFVASVPANVLVVLDEAYVEYLPKALQADSFAWVRKHPNLLVSRTLSKAYGLAGLRVGFGVGQPDLVDLMNRVRQPFNVNLVALAGATAALNDDAYIAQSVENNRAGMQQLLAAFAKLALDHIPSYGNFVCVKIGSAHRTAAVNNALQQQGVIVRPIAGYAMPEYLRISIGLPQENARFIEALEKALQSTKA